MALAVYLGMLKVASIVLNLPIYSEFSYIVPENITMISVGSRVLVSFGRKKLVGVIVSINKKHQEHEKYKYKLKEILSVIDYEPLIPKSIIELCSWTSDYYQYPLGQVIFSSIPGKLKKGGAFDPNKIKTYGYRPNKNYNKELLKNKPAQRELFEKILKKSFLLHSEINDKELVKKLIDRKLIDKIEYEEKNTKNTENITLNDEQNICYQKITKKINGFYSFLVEGVTGSGKTELYIKISKYISIMGDQVLIIVPEINLTPQTVSRFEKYLDCEVDYYHSSLTENKKIKSWMNCKSGKTKVIIGTRSSVFLPFKNLKLIIIDEEHDSSLKQQEKLRYHARDVSIIRAKKNNIPVIMGSATPSFESLLNCKNKKYEHLVLTNRFFKTKLPTVSLVDLNKDTPTEGFSAELKRQISKQLLNNEQTLLFIGRRGFSRTLLCAKCGWISKCHKCDAHMTYHASTKNLWCHHCGYQKKIDLKNICGCSDDSDIIHIGQGTERIEAKLNSLFPSANVMRIDSDTIFNTDKLNEFITKTKDGSIDILIGTQMLVKGHDFPKVSLVGIMDIDSGLYSLDFRGLEKTAQLIVQVSGRSGRHTSTGKVIIQTRKPNHPLLVELLKKGYHSFSDKALAERKMASLPPYSYIALLRSSGLFQNQVMMFLNDIKMNFDNTAGLNIMGPSPAPIARKNNKYEFQLMINSLNRKFLLQKTHKIREYIMKQKKSNIRWSIDIDPIDLY